MVNEYHNFTNLADAELQAWNRTAVSFNIAADEGVAKMKEYLSQFSKEENVAVQAMITRIKNDGYEQTRTAVNRGYQERRDVCIDYNVNEEVTS